MSMVDEKPEDDLRDKTELLNLQTTILKNLVPHPNLKDKTVAHLKMKMTTIFDK